MSKAKEKPQHYVDNKLFTADVADYSARYKTAKLKLEADGIKDRPVVDMTEFMGECIINIAEHLATKTNFSGYTYKSEMVLDAIENCFKYIHNFNIEKSQNAFAYATQISYYAFLRRIKSEKKQDYIKYKMFEREGFDNVMQSADERTKRFLNENNNTDYFKEMFNIADKDVEFFEKSKKKQNKQTSLHEYFGGE